MKSIITTALVLGLTIISCKKEVQTTTSSDLDTLPSMDSMNMNSTPLPSDTMTTAVTGDSMNTQKTDSALTKPK